MIWIYGVAAVIALGAAARRNALSSSVLLICLYAVFVLVADVLFMVLARQGAEAMAPWPVWLVLSKCLFALGEETARGVTTRLTIERRPAAEAVTVAFLSGLVLGLLERLILTATTSPPDLPLALQIAGHLKATLGHPALSVLLVLVRLRWQAPMTVCILVAGAVHAAANLAPDLIRTGSLAIEVTFGYGVFILLFLGILALGWRAMAVRDLIAYRSSRPPTSPG